MEIWELALYVVGTITAAGLILRFCNYDCEKPEDIEFK